MYHINVVIAIRSVCAGKSDGVDDIFSDNLNHTTDRFIVSLFNSILSHGCVPISFPSSTIPKNARLNIKNSENYRAIALRSVYGNFFDNIVIEKRVEQLGISELQFSYKTKRSTVMCINGNNRFIHLCYYKTSSICFINRCLEGF